MKPEICLRLVMQNTDLPEAPPSFLDRYRAIQSLHLLWPNQRSPFSAVGSVLAFFATRPQGSSLSSSTMD